MNSVSASESVKETLQQIQGKEQNKKWELLV